MIISKKVVSTKVVKKWKYDLEITNPESVVKAAEQISRKELNGEEREHVLVFALNTKNDITGFYIASIGSVNSAIVHPREVFRFAITEGATKIILVHNHPSGNAEPSNEDTEITKRIKEAGKIIGIELLDHIIIGSEGNYYTFRGEGRL